MPELYIEGSVPASPREVWGALTDHEAWVHWAGVQEVVVRQPGDPSPNGLGAIRVVRASGIALEEEVILFEPTKRIHFRTVSGLPLRNGLGEIELVPSDAGTVVSWCYRFSPSIPLTGSLLARLLEGRMRNVLDRLALVEFPC